MTTPLRIAVADDEPDMRDFYQTVLPRLGNIVVAAVSNGRDLLEQCRLHRPDLVITEIKMPDVDGIEAAATIYQQRPIPVILVSAYHDPETIQRAEADHVMSYLVKPVRAADLAPCIALARRRFADVQALAALSLTDELTGLNNRRGFLVLAEQQVKLAQRKEHKLSLLFIDVDGLKAINDTHRHQAGDRVLRETAEILRQTFRSSDILARLGGDEYCVLVIDDPSGAGAAIERLLNNVERRNAADRGAPAALSLSVGAVDIDPAAGIRVEDWLDIADKRMYEQKLAKRRMKEQIILHAVTTDAPA